MGYREGGSRLTLEVEDRSGVLYEVAGVIANMKISIISTGTFFYKGRRIVVVRIDSEDPSLVAAALEDRGYKLVASEDFEGEWGLIRGDSGLGRFKPVPLHGSWLRGRTCAPPGEFLSRIRSDAPDRARPAFFAPWPFRGLSSFSTADRSHGEPSVLPIPRARARFCAGVPVRRRETGWWKRNRICRILADNKGGRILCGRPRRADGAAMVEAGSGGISLMYYTEYETEPREKRDEAQVEGRAGSARGRGAFVRRVPGTAARAGRVRARLQGLGRFRQDSAPAQKGLGQRTAGSAGSAGSWTPRPGSCRASTSRPARSTIPRAGTRTTGRGPEGLFRRGVQARRSGAGDLFLPHDPGRADV